MRGRQLRHQLSWLIRKIVYAKVRKPHFWMTLMEFFLMAEFAILLLPLESLRKDISTELTPSPPPRSLPTMYLNESCSAPDSVLLFSPASTASRRVVGNAADLLSASGTALACATKGFASMEELLGAYISDPMLQHTAMAAFFFDDALATEPADREALSNYTIAVARELGESGRDDSVPTSLTDSRLAYDGHNDGDSWWVESGFVSLQWAIDRALMNEAAVAEGSDSSAAVALNFTNFPLQPYKSAYGTGDDVLEYLLPLYGCLSGFFIAMYLVNFLVNEKVYQLVAALHMMGMRIWLYYVSWWIVYGAVVSLAAGVQTLAFALFDFFPNSNYFLVFLTLELCALASVASSFVITALTRGKVNDPQSGKRTGQTLAFFYPMVALGIYVALIAAEAPRGVFTAFSAVLSHVAGPTAMHRFFERERVGDGLGWSDLLSVGTGPSVLTCWLLMLFHIALYIALAVFIDRRGYGSPPMPEARTNATSAEIEDASKPTGAAPTVVLRNLGRAFKVKPKPVVALANVSLELYEGQVTALLGQNGAGKTTLIGILTGLFPQSQGEATVYGHETRTSMDAIHRLSGVCPQHDLVFASLTVLENLRLVAAVKGGSGVQLTANGAREMLNRVGLEAEAHNARTDSLSGGQKRKLSLACALIGEPRLVLLDEPTAGMDPASRRTVWAAMGEAKANATLVLTTHFLDEADALGDRIAVLHRGRLQCVGSTSQLKRLYGTCFHLTISRHADGASSAELLALAREHVPGAELENEAVQQLSLALPQDETAAFAPLFAALDVSAETLGVTSYGLSIPSLQEVFLRITSAADEEEAARAEGEKLQSTQTGASLAAATSAVGPMRPAIGAAANNDQHEPTPAMLLEAGEGSAATYSYEQNGSTWRQQMRMGLLLYWQGMTQERAYIFFLVPFVAICLVFLLPPLLDTSADPDPIEPGIPTLEVVNVTAAAYGEVYPGLPLPYAPPLGELQTQIASSAFTDAFGYTPLPLEDVQSVLSDPSTGAGAAFDLITTALSTPAPTGEATVLLHNASHEGSFPAFLQLLDSALLAHYQWSSSLSTSAALLPYVGEEEPSLPRYVGAIIAPPAVAYVFTFVGLAVISYLVKDRLVDKVTHQQLVMGLSPALRWAFAAIFWCGLMYVYLILGGLVFVLAFPDYVPGLEGSAAFLVVCVASVPGLFLFLSLFNFLFWCRSDVEDVVGQVVCNVMGLVTIWPSILISVIPAINENPLARSIITYTLLIVPYNQLVFGLTAVYTVAQYSKYYEAYDPRRGATPAADYFVLTVESPTADGTIPGPLICILFSLVSLPFWFYALWYVDVRRYYYPRPPPPVGSKRDLIEDSDPDVAAERQRVENGEADESMVRVVRLSKSFKAPKKKGKRQPPNVAVDNLSLAIDGPGCFALLGPNGAGKTTTLSMLTGDLRPTSGEAWICGLSVHEQLMEIFKLLGYCPQFGGLFPTGITLKQHLQAYGRLKGVPEEKLDQHVQRVVGEFGLQGHENKSVAKLSGGTRRKLIAAIALACDPKVCFLDEPTTGVDVGTRSFLWQRIQAKAKQGCVLILTTHYMEEADALANRIGIMVNGRLQVLGTPQHLKSTHGGGYRIEIKGPAETAARARALVEKLFEGATQVDAYDGYQVFEVQTAIGGSGGFKLGTVFSALDAAKEDKDIALETYTLSQITLEQVFLRIVARQEGHEEGAL